MRDTCILLVEDDDELAALLVQYLSQHAFAVSRIRAGDGASERILSDNPDLVILDLMLPGANGLDICRRVRHRYSGSIMMLTASQSEADHVAGLELGADDFVNKPIEPRVLLARIRTQLRRQNHGLAHRGPVPQVLHVGPLTVDPVTRDVSVEGRSVNLTTMEFDVLFTLASDAGSVVTREDLYEKILNQTYDGLDRGMDVHVSRIRRKLQRCGFDPSRLKSVRGAGYLLAFR